MKVIGLTEVQISQYHKEKAYVVIITQHELAKVAGKAAYKDDKPDPRVGDEYPISEGHDFRAELTEALRKMGEAYTAFAKVAPVAAEFAGIVQRKAEQKDGAA